MPTRSASTCTRFCTHFLKFLTATHSVNGADARRVPVLARTHFVVFLSVFEDSKRSAWYNGSETKVREGSGAERRKGRGLQRGGHSPPKSRAPYMYIQYLHSVTPPAPSAVPRSCWSRWETAHEILTAENGNRVCLMKALSTKRGVGVSARPSRLPEYAKKHAKKLDRSRGLRTQLCQRLNSLLLKLRIL